MSISPARLFQCYLDNFFKVPKEIKNDLIYCQRALKAHITVHQMVVDAFKKQRNIDPHHKRRICEEIETEIFEINAEQHYLFLRLRRIIDEFYKKMKKNKIPIDENAVNMLISKEIVPVVNEPTIEIFPQSVIFRNTEEKLIKKYFEVPKKEEEEDDSKVIYEIEDTDDECKEVFPETITKSNVKQVIETVSVSDTLSSGSSSPPQISLLKPMAERISPNVSHTIDDDVQVIIPVDVPVEKKSTSQPSRAKATVAKASTSSSAAKSIHGNRSTAANKSAAANKSVSVDKSVSLVKNASAELPVSKNVKMSRLNLRQALKKAHTEKLAAKAAANGSLPRKISSTQSTKEEVKTAATATAANVPAQTAAAGRKGKSEKGTNRNNVSATKTIEIQSSSEDSNPERELIPAQSSAPIDPQELKTLPQHFEQETFLRYFQLFTPEILVQMQQRRSKRRRRNVHSNERADFHYGRIDNFNSCPAPEDAKKKRKAFLLSPQVKRNMQNKRVKRNNAEKTDEVVVQARSNSSSPDDKRACNECLKGGGGSLEKCDECKGLFHQSCHKDEKGEKAIAAGKKGKAKYCPACKRTLIRIQNNKTLHYTAEQLETKMTQEKNRRASLQQASKLYKIQMSNLYNIVNTIKTDDSGSSE